MRMRRNQILLLANLLSILSMLPPLLVLFGWAFSRPLLDFLFGDLPPMVPQTALSILFLAAALVCKISDPRFFRFSAWCALLLNLAIAAEYLFSVDLRIDLISRTSPQTCLVNILLAMSLLLPGVWLKRRQLANGLGLAMSLLAVVGFIYNAAHLFSVSKDIGMALPTALCLITLSLANFASEPDQGLLKTFTGNSASGVFLRRFAIFGLIIPFFVAGVIRFGEQRNLYGNDYSMAGLLFFTVAALAVLAAYTTRALARVEEQKMALKVRELELIEANEAGRMKSKFVANMSHELRTPLNAVLGYLECLRDTSLTPDIRDEFNARAKRCASGLLRLLEDIMDFSKLESDKIKLVVEPFNARELIEDVVDEFRASAQRKGVAVELTGLEKIPSKLGSDVDRLRQILLNLIGNAVKFTDHGSVQVDVSFVDGELLVTVIDTGIGIPLQARDRLFTVFSQVDDSITRRFGGSGLGLALSSRLATIMGGSIRLRESEPALGSTFELRIPCSKPVPVSEPAAPLPRPTSLNGKIFGSRVLLVDDNIDNQDLLRMFLTSLGADVSVAENGEVGVRMAMTKPQPDAILMDLQMPVMGGLEATRILRNNGLRMPIIAVTAHTTDQDKKRSLAAGCTLHLCKPVSKAQLLDAFQTALSLV